MDLTLLKKFESKTNRVKGLSFHPHRPWILVSLHNGVVQLYDYRMEILIDSFEEHDGPVRGIDFHHSMPLFVSGGDDYKVKVWNYQMRRCLYTLNGHLDYIRTVQFHPSTHPWILSSSDDQTVRIWNWQSRNCLVVLTGHNHYVMCAQWHPKEDLILSASLDQTIRIWDISGLTKRSTSVVDSSGGAPHAHGAGGRMAAPGAASDMFGTVDAVVKFVLEGHTRGVNWASFHPTQNLVVSGADDKEVKVWRMSGTRAWETTTYRGHLNNVSCVVFHAKENVIISNSEDRTLRMFDVSRSQSPLVFRRESDRYWILAAHPRLNLLAAGHDSGMFVFKLSRERPPADAYSDLVVYFKEGYIRVYNVSTDKDVPVMQSRASGHSAPGERSTLGSKHRSRKPRRLVFNPYSSKSSHNVALLFDNSPTASSLSSLGSATTSTSGRGASAGDAQFELYTFGSPTASARMSTTSSSGGHSSPLSSAQSVAFVNRNRLAVLDATTGDVELRNMENEVKKKLKIAERSVNYLFGGGMGRLLLRSPERVSLYDVTTRKIVREIQVLRYPVKFAKWAPNYKKVAMLTRYSVVICDAELNDVNTIFENSKVKSGAWIVTGERKYARSKGDSGVFIYTTNTHMKYALPNGDNGIIRTLEQVLYVQNCRGNTVYCLNREGEVVSFDIDNSEYLFKKALIERNYAVVKKLIDSGNLRGESIISYLQKKGYPEVALRFVSDAQTKFELAIECGNIEDAFECAQSINKAEVWARFGRAALMQGNYRHVAEAQKRTYNFDKLMNLFTITGNTPMLQKLAALSKQQTNWNMAYSIGALMGDSRAKVEALHSCGQTGLAYLSAAANAAATGHGSEVATALRQELTAKGKRITLPTWMRSDGAEAVAPLGFERVSALRPVWGPHADPSMYDWPRKEIHRGFFDQVDAVGDAKMADEATAADSDEDRAQGRGRAGISDQMLEESSADEGDVDFGFGDAQPPAGGSKKASTAASSESAVGWGDDGGFELSDESDAGDVAAVAGSGLDAVHFAAGSGPLFVMPRGGDTCVEVWKGRATSPADMVAAAAFDGAMEALNRQFAIVNFGNLKAHFLNIYTSSQCQLEMFPNASADLRVPLLRVNADGTPSQLPLISVRLQHCEDKVKEGYLCVTQAKFEEAETVFRSALEMVTLCVISTSEELMRARKVIETSREYVNAMRCKLLASADGGGADDMRKFELNCYFAEFELQDSHTFSALYAAIKIGYGLKMFQTIAVLCRRMLELGTSGRIKTEAATKHMQQISKVLKKCESKGGDSQKIAYDPRNFSGVCPMQFEAISRKDTTVRGPLCGSTFLKKYDGYLSPTCRLARIGTSAPGLTIHHT